MLAALMAPVLVACLAGQASAPPASPAWTAPPAETAPAPSTIGSPGASPESTAVPSPGSPGSSPAPSPTPTTGISPYLLSYLDSQLEQLRIQHGIPGISATILFRDGTRWTGVGGEADFARGLPVRPGTPFSTASISKTFTSALIMALVEEGRLTLEERAAPRLVGVPGVAIDPRITIAQLLNHTGGLRDFLLEPKIEPAFAANPDAAWTPARSLSFVGKPLAPPGERFYYSNTNYLLLGLIAEKVTGVSLAANLRGRFFQPMGLRTASYQAAELPAVPLARGYRFTTGLATETPIEIPTGTAVVPFNAVVTAAGGAGSVAAASPDLAAWARALYTGGVLKLSTVTRMVDDAARTKAIDPSLPYGLGVHVLAVGGHPSLGHSGRYLGARSVVRYFPLDGLTIAVLTNQSRTDPNEILLDLLAIALSG